MKMSAKTIAFSFLALVAFAAAGALEQYSCESELPRLDAFWDAIGDGDARFRRTYKAGHSMMGARLSLSDDLKAFILE